MPLIPLLLAALLAPAGAAERPPFTVIVLPDTQFYACDCAGGSHATFSAQTAWIAAQREALNIVYVAHVGDCVQNGDEVPEEWVWADAAMSNLEDTEVTGLPMYRHARLGMGYLSQEPSVFQRLTCEQNLLAILETLDLSRAQRKRRAAELLAQFGLTHKAKDQARTCSGGERRKLEIARALVTNPKLILLDEPFSGVDPIAVEDLQAEIRRLTERGISILITDHNVQQTLRVCDRAYIIDSGRVLAEGTPKELINDPMVRRVYLGSLFRGDEFDDATQPAEEHADA